MKNASECHRPVLYYKSVKGRHGLLAKEQVFSIDGVTPPHHYHPLSLHSTRTMKSRPRVQLTEEHARALKMPTIGAQSQDVTKIAFPDGTANYVMLARPNSTCKHLRSLHKHIMSEEKGNILHSFLMRQGKNSLVKDNLGGGRYFASGYGNMGRNVSPTVRPPTQPALRKSFKYAAHHELAKIVGRMYVYISKCIAEHCSDIYRANKEIAAKNPNLAWPPLEYQDVQWSWMSSQFIIRQRHPDSLTEEWPLEKDMVATHTDTGDLDCIMFHCYITGGGDRNKGGHVPGTDIAIFENRNGGAGYRVETCIEDTVVLVVYNSRRQLHGCIKPSNYVYGEGCAWSIRIIPYIPKGVHDWMLRNPNGTPYAKIP